MDMVLSKIENDDNHSYELNMSDYKKMYKSGACNIYRDLRKAVKSMEGAGFYLINSNDKGIEKETFFVWFSSIDYLETEGRIIVEVGQRLKNLLVEMKKRIYYKLEYPLNFNSIYSKRIYYYLKSFEDTKWRIDNLDVIRNKLQCPTSYEKYGLFRTKVLDVAYREINNNSDISFSFEEIKTGRKVTSIKFNIKSNQVKNEIAITLVEEGIPQRSIEEEQDQEDILSFIQETITPLEARKILDIANGNIEIVKMKYELSKKSKKPIGNLVAWLIDSIKKDYKDPTKKINVLPGESSKRQYAPGELEKLVFNRGQNNVSSKRVYDVDALEKKLLGRE